MINDNEITYIFNDVAHEYGIEYVSVRITHFKYFKIKWSKITDERNVRIHFTISHYMRLAPEWFVKESANRVLSKVLYGITPETTREYDFWVEENKHIWQSLRGE